MADNRCRAHADIPCEDPAGFEVTRVHDGGGRRVTCGAHLAITVHEVAASVPDWATNPTTATYVKELNQ